MDYAKIYRRLIDNRMQNTPVGYTETHHIVPKSLGGSNDKENLVKLTAKEHFISHLLLTKMYAKGSDEYYKMCYAFLMMLVTSQNQNRYITSKKYELLKKTRSVNMKEKQGGKNNSQYNTRWIHNTITLEDTKIKISDDYILPEGCVFVRKSTKTIMTIKCEYCFNEFNSYNKRKYCSRKCCGHATQPNTTDKSRKRVMDENGIIYNSLHDASIALGITPEGVAYRIKRGKGSYL